MGIVLITGGTGMVGRALSAQLSRSGDTVRILSRSESNSPGVYRWDPYRGEIEEEAVAGVDTVVHLAGTSVASGRWTEARRNMIRRSRLETAQFLYRIFEERGQSLRRFVSISGVGFYGPNNPDPVEENGNPGNGFLAEVCREWEFAAQQFSQHGADVYVARAGVVMARDGDFLKKLEPLFRLHLGAVLGSGNQHSSWIHIADLADILTQMVHGHLPAGTYNAVSPGVVEHGEMMHALARAMKRRIFLPNVPAWALKLLLGELAVEVLSDMHVKPLALHKAGFTFRFTDINSCFQNLYSHPKQARPQIP